MTCGKRQVSSPFRSQYLSLFRIAYSPLCIMECPLMPKNDCQSWTWIRPIAIESVGSSPVILFRRVLFGVNSSSLLDSSSGFKWLILRDVVVVPFAVIFVLRRFIVWKQWCSLVILLTDHARVIVLRCLKRRTLAEAISRI